MKWLLVSMIVLFGSITFASNAPPSMPTEYWGRLYIGDSLASDGTEVKYYDGTQWTTTTTKDGWYDIMMTGGDSDLTFAEDPTCSEHWAQSKACIPCNDSDASKKCSEGPKTGDTVHIQANGVSVKARWSVDAAVGENVIALIPLVEGWNMISLPIEPQDPAFSSVISGLSGRKQVFTYDQDWKSCDTTVPQSLCSLKTMEVNKAYWLKSDIAQTLTIIGKESDASTLSLKAGWNMVSFQLFEDNVKNIMSRLSGRKQVFYYNSAGKWESCDNTVPEKFWTLQGVEIAKGYWLQVDSDQDWVR